MKSVVEKLFIWLLLSVDNVFQNQSLLKLVFCHLGRLSSAHVQILKLDFIVVTNNRSSSTLFNYDKVLKRLAFFFNNLSKNKFFGLQEINQSHNESDFEFLKNRTYFEQIDNPVFLVFGLISKNILVNNDRKLK
jgi:hypothetical protein